MRSAAGGESEELLRVAATTHALSVAQAWRGVAVRARSGTEFAQPVGMAGVFQSQVADEGEAKPIQEEDGGESVEPPAVTPAADGEREKICDAKVLRKMRKWLEKHSAPETDWDAEQALAALEALRLEAWEQLKEETLSGDVWKLYRTWMEAWRHALFDFKEKLREADREDGGKEGEASPSEGGGEAGGTDASGEEGGVNGPTEGEGGAISHPFDKDHPLPTEDQGTKFDIEGLDGEKYILLLKHEKELGKTKRGKWEKFRKTPDCWKSIAEGQFVCGPCGASGSHLIGLFQG